jgi:hypothetical protein
MTIGLTILSVGRPSLENHWLSPGTLATHGNLELLAIFSGFVLTAGQTLFAEYLVSFRCSSREWFQLDLRDQTAVQSRHKGASSQISSLSNPA